MNAVDEKISCIGIVPKIKLNNTERDAENLGRALCAGEVPVAEIAFKAEGADIAIRIMSNSCQNMVIEAGTVTRTEQIDSAINAGAKFIVTPGFDSELVAYAQSKNVPIYPGCTTPKDYHSALKFGLESIKFFPAEQSGGLAKIKAMSATFPQFKVMPTGGISPNNSREYISSPVVATCGGSYMLTAKIIKGVRYL